MSEMNTTQIAEFLGYSPKYVRDVLCKRPDFPKPCQNISNRKRRWRFDEILRFKRGS